MPDDQQPSAGDPIDAEVVPADDVPAGQAPMELTPVPVDTGYTSAGVPTFDSVREKIETRFGTAIGSVELAEETPEGRSVAEQYEARQEAAAERLKQIRESMNPD
jgi:phage shock protein A